MRGKQVGVVGGGECSGEVETLANQVGRAIAAQGWTLVCGGLGGVMEAAAKGAKAAGGLTLGILPSYNLESANPYIDVAVATGLGLARNVLVVSASDAVIALTGSHGTRSEVSLALHMGKVVAGLRAWEDIPGVSPVKTVEEAVRVVLRG